MATMDAVTVPADILEQLLSLPEAERASVARKLLQSLGGPSEKDDEAWFAEVRERVDAVRSGESAGIPLDDVMAEARTILGR